MFNSDNPNPIFSFSYLIKVGDEIKAVKRLKSESNNSNYGESIRNTVNDNDECAQSLQHHQVHSNTYLKHHLRTPMQRTWKAWNLSFISKINMHSRGLTGLHILCNKWSVVKVVRLLMEDYCCRGVLVVAFIHSFFKVYFFFHKYTLCLLTILLENPTVNTLSTPIFLAPNKHW